MWSVLVYAGLLAVLVGGTSLVRPLRLLGIGSRGRAGTIASLGALAAFAGLALPSPLQRSSGSRAGIDDFAPSWQFAEHHETRVHAPPERAYEAIRAVSAAEIRFFRLLTWIRSPRLPWHKVPESILAPAPDQPILDVALRSGFLLLAEDPGREIVVGAVVCCRRPPAPFGPAEFASLDEPGYAKAVMNFRVLEEGGGFSRVTTETRVFATDASARWRFQVYWRLIYPGSALIRRMWLAAIRARAERV